MPHRVVRLFAIVRRVSPSLLLCCGVLACSRTGTMRVVIDSTLAGAGEEVLAVPFDPAPLAPAAAPTPRAAASDSLALYYAVADSADSLDAAYQRLRTDLNGEARALDGADRRSSTYATHYAAFQERSNAAESLRVRRDRLRTRRDALRGRLGSRIPVAGERPATHSLATALDSAAHAAGRSIVRGRARNGVAVLELPPGEWWLTFQRGDGSLYAPAAARRITAGARDTLRLGGT